MPIEIRELVIRATVSPGAAAGSDTPSSSGAEPAHSDDTRAQDGLVQTCVREVLRILGEQRER